MGNYNHNVQVLETGVGELILARRPSEGVEACPEDFLPCPCCLGFFKKDELWRHSKTCDFKLEEDKGEDASEEDKKSKKNTGKEQNHADVSTKTPRKSMPESCPSKNEIR